LPSKIPDGWKPPTKVEQSGKKGRQEDLKKKGSLAEVERAYPEILIKAQQWQVVYLEDAKGPQTKGLNKDFGFHVGRPFYLISKLPFNRMIECIGANNVTMRRWRNNAKAQQWFFDGVSKTIKNNNWKSHSLDIQSNGGSTNVRCTTTNSRWW
jgi:hypothetical protein